MMQAADETMLVGCLTALASGNRLTILRALRTPRSLSEIEVPDEATGTPLARQSVRRHLDALLEVGMVSARPTSRHGRDTIEFVVNHQRIFALAEEVRTLARLRPTVEPEAITEGATPAEGSPRAGPLLLLVRGLDEGTTFPLTPRRQGATWVVGRRRGVGVALDFDASVSSEHAAITFDEGAAILRDLGSRNGTTHNLRRLLPEERVALRHGDVIGVGHSLLLYWS